MRRILCPLAALLACGPQTADESGDATSTTGATTDVTPTSSDATSSDATTGDGTTGDATTSDGTTTTGVDPCPWYEDEFAAYCPLLAAPNVDIAGDTPFGPVELRYAYFGLFNCGFCPGPEHPTLGLFAQPQQPGLEPFVGDHLLFQAVEDGSVSDITGEIAGMPVSSAGPPPPQFSGLMLVPAEEMELPLELASPPTISGTLDITGGGWALAGEFTASFCKTLDLNVACS